MVTTKRLVSLIETMLVNETAAGGHSAIDSEAKSELAGLLVEPQPEAPPSIDPGERIALLASLFDGDLDEQGRRKADSLFASSSADLHDALASLAFLDGVMERNVVQRPGGSGQDEAVSGLDWFRPLAAASKTGSQAILCRSDGGLWTLEVFIGHSERDKTLQQGYLLLTVDPEYNAAYEGRPARVFVKAGEEKLVLLEKVVQNGEVFGPISLAGLDLRAKDPIGIEFVISPEGLREE